MQVIAVLLRNSENLLARASFLFVPSTFPSTYMKHKSGTNFRDTLYFGTLTRRNTLFSHTGMAAEVYQLDGHELSVDVIPFRSGDVMFRNLAIAVRFSRCTHPVKQEDSRRAH